MTFSTYQSPLQRVQVLELSGDKSIPRQISLLELDHEVPFPIRRVYWIHTLEALEVRGMHAHMVMQQLLVAVCGSFLIKLDDGVNSKEFTLNTPTQALWVPAGLWRHITTLVSDSALLAFASTHFDESDYIRDYHEFLRYVSRLSGKPSD